MNRSDLVNAIAGRFLSLTVKDTDLAVHLILEAIRDALASGRRAEIRGFGSFDTYVRRARTGRNPKTGTLVVVSAKRVVHFKPGKEMRERVAVGDTSQRPELHSQKRRQAVGVGL